MEDRIKEIEERFNAAEWFEGYHLNVEDIEWLIKQAKATNIIKQEIKDKWGTEFVSVHLLNQIFNKE